MLRIRGKSTSLICWEENRQIAEIAAGLIMSVLGILCFKTGLGRIIKIHRFISQFSGLMPCLFSPCHHHDMGSHSRKNAGNCLSAFSKPAHKYL